MLLSDMLIIVGVGTGIVATLVCVFYGAVVWLEWLTKRGREEKCVEAV